MSDRSLLGKLLKLFYVDSQALGELHWVEESTLPTDYRRLLAHEEHMTVTVEAFHGSSVDVEVLDSLWTPPIYCRKILLRRSSDAQTVLFGLVRLDTSVLQQDVRDEILAGKIPLGRVLIEHDVLRKVRLEDLWEVTIGDELAGYFSGKRGVTYGRTARILFGTTPALELLEIVAPVLTKLQY